VFETTGCDLVSVHGVGADVIEQFQVEGIVTALAAGKSLVVVIREQVIALGAPVATVVRGSEEVAKVFQ
jgi:hypothetical protein